MNAIIDPRYHLENLSLLSTLKKGEYEVYKNDTVAVGKMYLNSWLRFEFQKLQEGDKRELLIFSDNFREDLYDQDMIGKLEDFSNKGGDLKILVREFNSSSENRVKSISNSVKKNDNVGFKTTFIVTNESFAWELQDYMKGDLSKHEAYFANNVRLYPKLKTLREEYRNQFLNTWNNSL